jgi:hypothetical protein
MSKECSKLVAAYLAWLKAKIAVKEINGVCEITTPFVDRHNDRLQIYLTKKDGKLLLSDDGFIISDLETSGCRLDTTHRKDILNTILAGYGVHQENDELVIEAREDNFAQKKHSLLQAMLAVNDMFMIATGRVSSLFFEDVSHFLEENDIRNTSAVDFTGKSGFIQRFDFVIPKSRKKPERIIRAINHPTRDNATSLIFAWNDIREVRPPNALVYAVLNDSEEQTNPDVLSAFQQYDVRPILWSQRQEYLPELIA